MCRRELFKVLITSTQNLNYEHIVVFVFQKLWIDFQLLKWPAHPDLIHSNMNFDIADSAKNFQHFQRVEINGVICPVVPVPVIVAVQKLYTVSVTRTPNKKTKKLPLPFCNRYDI